MSDIKERIRKVLVMAQRGEPGERDNAQRLLTQLLEKYKLTLEDINPKAQATVHWFRFRSAIERQLLVQCVAKVTSRATLSPWGRRKAKGKGHRPGIVGFEMTPIEYAEARHMYDHFRKHWKKQVESLLTAFITRYDLQAPPSDTPGDSEPMSDEEYEAVRAMMRGLGKSGYVSLRRTLGSG